MLTYKVLEDPLGQKNTNMCPQLSLDLQSNYTHKPRKENMQLKQHASKFWLKLNLQHVKEMITSRFIHLGITDQFFKFLLSRE